MTSVPLRQNHHKVINELDMPVGPVRAQWESLGSCPEPTIISSYLRGSAIIKSLLKSQQSKTINHGCSTRVSRPISRTHTSKMKTRHRNCLFFISYSWVARSPRFTDSVMLPDRPHIPNDITPQHQCGLLWIVADIFAWQSLQLRGMIWAAEKIITCKLCYYEDP